MELSSCLRKPWLAFLAILQSMFVSFIINIIFDLLSFQVYRRDKPKRGVVQLFAQALVSLFGNFTIHVCFLHYEYHGLSFVMSRRMWSCPLAILQSMFAHFIVNIMFYLLSCQVRRRDERGVVQPFAQTLVSLFGDRVNVGNSGGRQSSHFVGLQYLPVSPRLR